MITIVVNDKEAEITAEHFIVLTVALSRMQKTIRDIVRDAFINGDDKLHETTFNEYIRVQALVDALSELGNSLTNEKIKMATAWVNAL